MAETIPRTKIDLTPWYEDRKDEVYKQPAKRSEQPRRRAPKQERGVPRPDLHRKALRQVARVVISRKDFMECAESLAEELNVPLDRLYFIALAGFFEKYEENLEAHADDLHTSSSSYWEAGECTEEEFNAILEADRLEPELAESYKDSLED